MRPIVIPISDNYKKIEHLTIMRTLQHAINVRKQKQELRNQIFLILKYI